MFLQKIKALFVSFDNLCIGVSAHATYRLEHQAHISKQTQGDVLLGMMIMNVVVLTVLTLSLFSNENYSLLFFSTIAGLLAFTPATVDSCREAVHYCKKENISSLLLENEIISKRRGRRLVYIFLFLFTGAVFTENIANPLRHYLNLNTLQYGSLFAIPLTISTEMILEYFYCTLTPTKEP